MARGPRVQDDGQVYHAHNWGNNRATVFADDDDHLAFLQALADTRERRPFGLFGYCLMPDHFHLLLRPEPGQSISRIVQSLTVTHTWRFHKRHQSSGHVWQGRFRSAMVQQDEHLLVVLRYIEANPLRAGVVADLAEYRWSSFPHHGLGHDDPLLSPFPAWDELGRTPGERRRRWRAKLHRAARGGAVRRAAIAPERASAGRGRLDRAHRKAPGHQLEPAPARPAPQAGLSGCTRSLRWERRRVLFEHRGGAPARWRSASGNPGLRVSGCSADAESRGVDKSRRPAWLDDARWYHSLIEEGSAQPVSVFDATDRDEVTSESPGTLFLRPGASVALFAEAAGARCRRASGGHD